MDWLEFTVQYLHLRNPDLISEISQAGKESFLKRGTLLLHAGELQREFSFLIDGLLRGFTVGTDGRDSTDCFAFQRYHPALGCFRLDAPARISIEALEDSTIFSLPVSFLHRIMEQYPEAAQSYSALLSGALDRHWSVKYALRQLNTKDRYRWFCQTFPELQHRISQKHIASFLGTTPENLSRIRNELYHAEYGLSWPL